MNINVYLEEPVAKALDRQVKTLGRTRNAIIREAVTEWLVTHEVKKWPDSILKFKGIKDATAFKKNRGELLPPKEDPFE
jgi:hypothetical protein